jgi:hypothetical protein
VSTGVTGLIVLLLTSTIWLGMRYVGQQQPALPHSPAWQGVAPSIARVVLLFHEETAEQTFRGLLQELGAHIVNGPSPEGFYSIEVPLHASSLASLDAVIAVLKARADIVKFVAPIQQTP